MTEDLVKILMIDDDEDDYFLVSSLLDDIAPGQYKVDWAGTYNEGIAAIAKRGHDIYLIDYRLGQYTGIDILRHFQEIAYKAPVIILTGKGDYSIDKEAMTAGASDYLVKGEISAAVLERTVRYVLDEFRHLRAIAESERKYFGIFEKSHDLILLADCNKKIIDANPAALRKMEYSKDELLELHMQDLFLEKEQGGEFVEEICKEDAITHVEYIFKSKSGNRLDVLVNANMLDEENNVFLCVAEDITRRKREELEKRQQEKFVVSGRIARVIAHEVRNPLTNILLAVSQFKLEPVSPNPEESVVYLDIVERNCHRINQLVTELLQSTRMMDLHPEAVFANQLLLKTLEHAQDRLQLNGIKVEKNLMRPDVILQLDIDKMIIALLNIVINAIEAMKPNEGVLTLTTYLEKDKVCIRIKDNGIGIPEENKVRLFEPFFTDKTKGTGLGLTSTQNIILNHKGSIHVESARGHGTEFVILLPVQ
ncbi:hybrid sensor histidine kinase/response regulator [uncultured Chitinophaga sp.]|uniref:hybrid sensor histidine kinase/response regulator n=1 Tax=uncultured Chitinophaga sp. TaxID=339340 RepID=UPI0025EB38EC|nr:hybrid sensor histidine kinase/response regulator [uncultured Chitinophaga sp.]